MKYIYYIALIPVAAVEAVFAVVEGVTAIISSALAIFRVWVYRNYDYRRWLKRDLADCDTILELGCGSNSPILQIGYGAKTTAVDIWQPYVDQHRRAKDYKHITRADILTMPIPVGAYDAVVLCDVLEHLDRDDVKDSDLFISIEKCAKKKVILFTPNGFIENDLVDGDPYQAHLSAWEPRDYMERGYTVKGATGLRWILGKASRPRYRPHSIWEILAMLSHPLIYDHPRWAWHSYAVKELQK